MLRRLRNNSVFAILCGMAPTAALAATPKQSDFCHRGEVDKERLAIFALDNAGVSRNPERWADQHRAGFEGLSPLQRVIVDEEFCATGDTAENGAPKCAKGDAEKLSMAWNTVNNILQQPHAFENVGGASDPGSFFRNPQARLACRQNDEDKPEEILPTEIASPLNVENLPIRVRGSTDGLQFSRDVPAFAGLDKASLAIKDDNVGKKETFKLAAILGLALAVGPRAQLVPYVGLSRESSKKDGQPKDTTTDTLRAGLVGSYSILDDGGTHVLTMRAEFASNRVEHSEVVSINSTYTPIFNNRLNSYIPIKDDEGRFLFSFVPKLDVRVNWGTFIKSGTRAAGTSEDFLRAGFQIGGVLVSELEWLPAELTVTETYLWGLEGSPGHLSQLKGTLSLYFHKNKYFGVDLGYVRGRREDLFPREDNWTFGLGVKF